MRKCKLKMVLCVLQVFVTPLNPLGRQEVRMMSYLWNSANIYVY